jgi:mannosyltransferase OCH1-like enzyme
MCKIILLLLLLVILLIVLLWICLPHKENYHELNGASDRLLNDQQVLQFQRFLEFYPPDKQLIKKNLSNIPIFVTNLQRHSARRNKLLIDAKRAGININIITGIDYKNLNINENGQSKETIMLAKQPITYNNTRVLPEPAVLACCLSHIQVILHLSKMQGDIFLIIEDDVNLPIIQYWEKSLLDIIRDETPSDWEWLSIYSGNCENRDVSSSIQDTVENVCWGCVAYLVNKKGIKKLISKLIVNNTINFDKFHDYPISDVLLPRLIKSYTCNFSYLFPINSEVINSTLHKWQTPESIDMQSKIADSYIKQSNVESKWKQFIAIQNKISYLDKHILNVKDKKLGYLLREIDVKANIFSDNNIVNNEHRQYERCKNNLTNLKLLSNKISQYTRGNYEEIPKIIHQIWIGPKDPPMKLLDSVKQFVTNNPFWSYRLWREEDIEKLDLCNYEAYLQEKSYAGKADILRYEILWKFGGIYIDADSLYLGKKDLTDLISAKSGFFCAYETHDKTIGLSNGTIGCTQYNPIMYLLVKATNIKNLQLCPDIPAFITLGPYLLDKILKFLITYITIFPADAFYPVWWMEKTTLSINELKQKYGTRSYLYQYGYTTNSYETHEIM